MFATVLMTLIYIYLIKEKKIQVCLTDRKSYMTSNFHVPDVPDVPDPEQISWYHHDSGGSSL